MVDTNADIRWLFRSAYDTYGDGYGLHSFGKYGVELKRNVEKSWRESFVLRDDNFEVETPVLLTKPVAKAWGYIDGYGDLVIRCNQCEIRSRADHLLEEELGWTDAESLSPAEATELIEVHDLGCPNCNVALSDTEAELFSLLFEANMGAERSPVYFRPETAEASFSEFPAIKATEDLPIGIAQVGKSFRDELRCPESMKRLREFTLAELQLFFDPTQEPELGEIDRVEVPLLPAPNRRATDDIQWMSIDEALSENVIHSPWQGYYLGVVMQWFRSIGVDTDRLRFLEIPPNDLVGPVVSIWDAEAEVGGDWVEITGLYHHSGDVLSNHREHSDQSFTIECEDGETRFPDIIEPSTGLDRVCYVISNHSFDSETNEFTFEPAVSPILAEIDVATESRSSDQVSVLQRKVRRYGRRIADIEDVPDSIAVPYRIVVDDGIDLHDRRTGTRERLSVDETVDRLVYSAW